MTGMDWLLLALGVVGMALLGLWRLIRDRYDEVGR